MHSKTGNRERENLQQIKEGETIEGDRRRRKKAPQHIHLLEQRSFIAQRCNIFAGAKAVNQSFT